MQLCCSAEASGPGEGGTIQMQHKQQFELLSIEQVADLLNVSTKTVRRLITKEHLRFHRIGRIIRVSWEDLRSYLNATRA